jgi:two-component system, sensor histidine kinase and response regulator
VTWLLLFVGIGGSVVGAAEWRTNQRQSARHSFNVQASVVTSSVALSLDRLNDLTATMRAAVSTRPHMTSREWDNWSADLDVAHRYPGSLGLAFARVVPASQLAAYEAKVTADPPAGATGNTPFAVVPPGARPFYCFIRFRSQSSVLEQLPIGLDLCQVGGRGFFSKPRDTGQFHVTPVALGGASVAAIFAPVYRGGLVPATVAARRGRFVGLVGGLFNVEKLLGGALGHYHGLSATLSRQDIGSSTAAQSAASGVSGAFGQTPGSIVGAFGRPPTQSVVSHTKTFNSDGEWTITVSASDAAVDQQTTTEALYWLLIGLAMTVMAFALLRVLVRGRQRALEPVERRTGQLNPS